jgi:hypothetical protein
MAIGTPMIVMGERYLNHMLPAEVYWGSAWWLRQMRNYLTALMMAIGTPMLTLPPNPHLLHVRTHCPSTNAQVTRLPSHTTATTTGTVTTPS